LKFVRRNFASPTSIAVRRSPAEPAQNGRRNNGKLERLSNKWHRQERQPLPFPLQHIGHLPMCHQQRAAAGVVEIEALLVTSASSQPWIGPVAQINIDPGLRRGDE
jgi:hypothetical protein